MKRKYEALIVLNTRGKEDTVDTIVSKLGREMELEGATLDQIDHIGKRKFPYGGKKLADGYFVNYQIQAAPAVLDKVKARLRLNPDVYQQNFMRLG
jgi:small subunit ribosomal protein S6